MTFFGRHYDRRLVISAAFTILLAVTFWSGSRVPQLSEKASMGAETEMDSIGFETVLLVQADDPPPKKILYATVNWVETNKKGMAFGVLFAAALMTIFSLLRRRAFKNSFANSALGMIIGAPLGVCVNCAAPIATGMAATGARIETTLAVMISSPTLNVIVLTMLFSLFPLYIVILKIGLSVGFVLLGIPLLCRYILKRDVDRSTKENSAGILANQTCELPVSITGSEIDQSWSESFSWTGRTYLSNLWFVAKSTVPLMFLAGFLGAALITLLPLDSLAEIFPGDGGVSTIAGMLVVAVVGTFLPVPIAFDVLVTSVLLAAGMPVKYALILLITLGTFSIYSYFIVSRAISRRAAITLFMAVVGLGLSAGVFGRYLSVIDEDRKREFFIEFIFANKDMPEPTLMFTGGPDPTVDPPSVSPLKTHEFYAADGVRIERIDFSSLSEPADRPFTKLPATQLGIDVPYRFTLLRMEIPFVQGYGRGVSSGDVNNDGWVDLLFHTDTGLLLFINNSGQSFYRAPVNIHALSDEPLVNAALVDLNNDGWLDIYFSVFQDGGYIIYSAHGDFKNSAVMRLSQLDDENLSSSAGFGDIDRDGDLEIVLGNWALAWGKGAWLTSDASKIVIYDRHGDQYDMRPLDLPPGIPTTIFVSDYTNDGHVDLIIGNDFSPPDYFLYGDSTGNFTQIFREDGIIPHGTFDTMSIDSADIDNNLSLELFLADLARYDDNHEQFGTIPFSESCEEFSDKHEREYCSYYSEIHELFAGIKQTRKVAQCMQIKDRRLQIECVTAFIISQPVERGGFASTESCAMLPEHWEAVKRMCSSVLRPSGEPAEDVLARQIPEKRQKNTLLMMDASGVFTDVSADMGLELAGWAWNSRFADLDNDEYQDLFIVNGTYRSNQRLESNYFFRNREGKHFDNLTEEFGFTSYLATSSYTYIDFDNDGDLDVVVIPVNGPVSVYRNNNHSGNRIAFMLRDSVGNSYGIGSKIIIHYGPDGERHQIREIKASGGFISYDAPIAYFGLDKYETIHRVEVLWSTGEKTVLDHPFEHGARYLIHRFDIDISN